MAEQPHADLDVVVGNYPNIVVVALVVAAAAVDTVFRHDDDESHLGSVLEVRARARLVCVKLGMLHRYVKTVECSRVFRVYSSQHFRFA